MKKLLVLLLVISPLLMGQSIRRSPWITQTTASSYAVNKVIGSYYVIPEAETYAGHKGYMPYLLGTTDTTNTNNSVRVYIFADTVGFGTVTPGMTFVLSDTMSYQLRGTVLLSFTSGGTPSTSGNGFAESRDYLPYAKAIGAGRYALAVSEVACTFNYPSGVLRILFTYDDY